jgi:small-conductance mechanosensitive channel
VTVSIGGDAAFSTLLAAAVFAAGLVLARAVAALLYQIVLRALPGIEEERADYIASRLRTPAGLLIAGLGTVIALRLLPFFSDVHSRIDRVGVAVVVASAVWLVQRAVTASMDWASTGSALVGGPVGHVLPLARRGADVAILVIGGLLVLDQLGISISPLLAGLGIGGVAVALALQPLLTNLFAGSYVLSDASVRVGDYIVFWEPGRSSEGRIESIGWRATRLRDVRDGSVVVVPNATIAASTLTNFGPTGAVYATTSCTLPPGLNLDAVEQALTEELAALARDHEEVSAEAQPTIRFERFDGTSVVCTVRLRARSHSDVPQLTHLLVKRVNERLLAGLTPRGDAAAR